MNTPSFIPDNQFVSDEDRLQQTHGTLPQQALAGVEAGARGLTLGTSDIAEAKLGEELGLTTKEDIAARREANPVTQAVGNIAGNVGLIGLTGGIAAPAEAALAARGVGGLAARAAGFGLEGAALGAGNVVSDAALGDPNVNAQKIMSDIGLSAIFGGGLGVLSKGIEAAPFLRRAAQESEAIAPTAEGLPNPEAAVGGEKVFDEPSMGIKPTSIEDLKSRIREAGYRGERVELPQKSALTDAASRVEMLNPIHPLQVESLENQSARDLYKTAMEMPGKEGDAIRSYEALQKQELTKSTKRLVDDLAPEAKRVTGNAVEGGERASDIFTEQYQAEKKEAGKLIGEIKSLDYGTGDHLGGVLDHMTEAVPGVARMFDTAAEEVKMLPYSTKWGVEKATYNAVKQAVEALKTGDTDFETLLNIRKGLDQNIDLMKGGAAAQEISGLKRSMMDYAQGIIDESGLPIEAREAFKRYAINEEQRKVIEKAFGASVGSPEFGQLSRVKPEEISDKIFRNTATVKAAKNILDPKEFNEILANHLAEQIDKVTDKGAFSSNKFGSFLKRNQDVLNEAFADKPNMLTKIKDMNTIMRILPDSASINPSGTAKTLWGILKAHSIPDLIGNIKGYAGEKVQEKMLADKVNAALAGRADQATKIQTIQKIVDKQSNKIEKLSKSIFSSRELKSAVMSGAALSIDNYDKDVEKVKRLANDPTAMMDHLGDNTDALYAAAPNITQGLHSTVIAAAQFLNSKIPTSPNHFILSREYEPSDAEKYKFMKYYQAVDEPIMSMKMVKDGNLTNETMEAVSTVHPHLLDEMKKSILSNFDSDGAKNLNYQQKISLAKFLGEPLDAHMTPQAITSYQASLMGPQLGTQSAKKSGRSTGQGGDKQMQISSRYATGPEKLQQSEEI